jgi:hypothetical protein
LLDEARSPVDERLPEREALLGRTVTAKLFAFDSRDVRAHEMHVGCIRLAMQHLAVGRDDGRCARGRESKSIPTLDMERELRERAPLVRRENDAVEIHVSSILRKAGAASRAQLAARYWRKAK